MLCRAIGPPDLSVEYTHPNIELLLLGLDWLWSGTGRRERNQRRCTGTFGSTNLLEIFVTPFQFREPHVFHPTPVIQYCYAMDSRAFCGQLVKMRFVIRYWRLNLSVLGERGRTVEKGLHGGATGVTSNRSISTATDR